MSKNKRRFIVFAGTLCVACLIMFSAYAACYSPFVAPLRPSNPPAQPSMWNSLHDYLVIIMLVTALITIPFFLTLLSNRFIKRKSPRRIWIFRGLIYTFFLFLTFLALVALSAIREANNLYLYACAKPVIYLYPTKEQEVRIKLSYHGELTTSYPTYDQSIKGWKVTAYPDGHLINEADRQTYSYLFWEGSGDNMKRDFSTGFVVAGKDTAAFLQKTLGQLGLTPKEYNEFIVYWLPKMESNPYNLIHFAGQEYTDTAPLEITPKPDSMLRVFMEYKPLTAKIDLPPQKITPFERKGFAVIEWGGSEDNSSSEVD